MFISEEFCKSNKGLWFLLSFTVVLEFVLLLLFSYKNIFIVLLILGTPPLLFFIIKKPLIGVWLIAIISFTSMSLWGSPVIIRIITALTLIAFSAKVLINREKLFGSEQLVFMIIFGVVALLSFYPARDLSLWGKGIERFFAILLFFILIVNLVKTDRDIWTLTYIIVFSITIAAIYGIYLFRTSGFLNILVSTGTLVRAGSVVVDANLWAVALVTAFPLSIALLKKEKNRILKLLLIAVVAIICPSIFMTFSRGGILAFLFITIIIIFKIIKRKLFGVIILLLLAIVVYFVLPPFVILRIKSLLLIFQNKGALDYSLLSRFYLMRGAFRMFLDHPILGVGILNVISNSGFYCPAVLHKVSHSIILEIAAGTGLLGLIPFLAIFYYAFKDFIISYKVFERKGEKSLADLSFYASLSLLGVCIAGLFLSIQFCRSIWFLIAFSVVLKNLAIDVKLKNQ